MRFPKLVLSLCFLWLLVSCGGETAPTTEDTTGSESQINNTNEANVAEEKMPSGTFCYAFTDANASVWSRIDINENQQVTGELHISNYSAAESYSAYGSKEFSGVLEDNRLDLNVTTTIEGSVDNSNETWFFSVRELETADNNLARVGCNEYADHLEYFEANPPFELQETFNQNKQDFVGDNGSGEVIECEASESVFLVAETENFWVNICGGDLPYTYIGVSKETGEALRLDLSDYDNDGSYYEARNGDYTYMVIFGTAKGSFLTVTQGDNQILQEPLISW